MAAPGDYDAFLAREVDAFMADDSDEPEVIEQDFYDDADDVCGQFWSP